MSSSISSSDAPGWRRFLLTYCAVAIGLGGLLVGTLVALDPYDTGHLSPFPSMGAVKSGQRIAGASRGRDPAFENAVIGNSHIQLVSPERLRDLTGRRFVSLAIPGTGPREQLAVAYWFLHNHPKPGVIILGVDAAWCKEDLTETNPFPYWLYTTKTPEFMAGLMRFESLEMAGKKVKLLLGKKEQARPDGYVDYELGRTWNAAEVRERLRAAKDASAHDEPHRTAFPAADKLRGFLAELPADAAVVLVFPPIHATSLPQPGTMAHTNLGACKNAFHTLAREAGSVRVLDMLVDNEVTRDEAQFWDNSHYRSSLARIIEEGIGQVLQSPAM